MRTRGAWQKRRPQIECLAFRLSGPFDKLEHMFELRNLALGRTAVDGVEPASDPEDFWLQIVGAIDGEGLSDERLVDELSAMERLTSGAAAAKARLTAELHARRARGVAHEVALARRESPHAGREHLGLAVALVGEMPETLAALTRGDIS